MLLCIMAVAATTHAQKTKPVTRKDTTRKVIRLTPGLNFNDDRFKRGYIESPLENLAGRLPGVSVTSGTGDRMAALTGVRVRGTTSITGGNDPWCSSMAYLPIWKPQYGVSGRHRSIRSAQGRGRNSAVWFERCLRCDCGHHKKREEWALPHQLRRECRRANCE